MFSVIFMHTAAGLLRGAVNMQWWLLNFCTSFAFTAVPLFLMMSGYLVLSSRKTLDVTFLCKKRLPHLLVPLAGWTVLAILRGLLLEENLTLRTFLSRLVKSFNEPAAVHFWYMYLMIALYVISPILYGGLHSLDRRGHLYVAALLAFVTVQTMLTALLPDRWDKLVAFDLAFKLKIFGGHLCTFVLGYYLGGLKHKIPNWLLASGALSLWMIISLGTYWLTVQKGEYTSTFQSQSAGFEVALAACIFLLFRQNARPSAFFRWVPVVPLSLPIYLMHNLLLAAFQTAGHFPRGFFSTVRMTAVNALLCFLAVKTAATIKPLCYLFTGMHYQAACQSCNWVFTYRNIKSWLQRQ
ncbi:MAG: acyltransferase family protein [Oscillospiraceae bacterium]|nr:acyltransferase family protein [Oscillospiraceae bacterium]